MITDKHTVIQLFVLRWHFGHRFFCVFIGCKIECMRGTSTGNHCGHTTNWSDKEIINWFVFSLRLQHLYKPRHSFGFDHIVHCGYYRLSSRYRWQTLHSCLFKKKKNVLFSIKMKEYPNEIFICKITNFLHDFCWLSI